ncbi:hypothetical protein [Pyxidicoccus xibeiensis]|uniref:hypothetical protein n=1 Tax=Pyxidicoccus xibeiensis TaxID=2906759 RepID=UPI0020A7F027|nr:hypothetical protein [Pyxidicoccus xibeiensis]MCP3139349.1 hypothetical protein [Pyxidicoccus xibeiensis]
MLRRLALLLVPAGLLLGASLSPRSAHAQATPPAPAVTPAPSSTPARPPASRRKPAPVEAPAPAATPAPIPSAPPPVQAVEYTFLRREDPETDLAQLQQLGAEGWRVVATVDVDGSTRRYVLMRPKQ